MLIIDEKKPDAVFIFFATGQGNPGAEKFSLVARCSFHTLCYTANTEKQCAKL